MKYRIEYTAVFTIDIDAETEAAALAMAFDRPLEVWDDCEPISETIEVQP